MTTLTLKANSRGSWANVCDFPEEDLPYVQEAAADIAHAAGGRVAFKITDATGTTVHKLDPKKSPSWTAAAH